MEAPLLGLLTTTEKSGNSAKTARPTVHTNLSRKQSFKFRKRSLNRPEKFEKVSLAFYQGRKTFSKRSFSKSQ